MNPIDQVTNWIDAAKQARTMRNEANYFGYMLEELSEGLLAVSGKHPALLEVARVMKAVSVDFRVGAFDEHFTNLSLGNAIELMDSAIDTAWVSIGLAHIMGDAKAAFTEVARSNWSKFHDGVAVLDATGKVVKPLTYQKPYLLPYITPRSN